MFDSFKWKELSLEKIRDEIEKHFELLLKKDNLTINVSKGQTVYTCKPFDYEAFAGEDYQKTFPISETKKTILTEYGDLNIYLKFTNGKSIDRLPVFISKNRRIVEVYKVEKLNSMSKKAIWKHPCIIGYIDTGNMLHPTIARNDFKNDKISRLVFSKIKDAEPEISEFINKQVKAHSKSDFSKLESMFNSAIDKLSFDGNFETHSVKGGKKFMNDDDEDSFGSNHSSLQSTGGSNSSGTKNSGNKRKGKYKSLGSSFKIRIDDESDPVEDSDGKKKRSEFVTNEVIIYKKHQDFMDRIDVRDSGIEYISSSLVTYLIGEVLTHYIPLFYESKEQSDKGKVLYFADCLYKMENSLKNLAGESITVL
ncbi:MAG: hypothetical protein NTY74_14595 [Ignavibacteriae bacterium]|nr:hypothetical protein [Ignavibacteriota bacterium]